MWVEELLHTVPFRIIWLTQHILYTILVQDSKWSVSTMCIKVTTHKKEASTWVMSIPESQLNGWVDVRPFEPIIVVITPFSSIFRIIVPSTK